jgi:hypothetical protein
MNTTAHALKVATGSEGGDSETIAVFATAIEAADYYGTREDLRGYFWGVHPEVLAPDAPLPHIYWPPERVAEALARQPGDV